MLGVLAEFLVGAAERGKVTDQDRLGPQLHAEPRLDLCTLGLQNPPVLGMHEPWIGLPAERINIARPGTALDERVLTALETADKILLVISLELSAIKSAKIFLEVAAFNPARIRATRRALGISTDASYRFERGVDVDAIPGLVREKRRRSQQRRGHRRHTLRHRTLGGAKLHGAIPGTRVVVALGRSQPHCARDGDSH